MTHLATLSPAGSATGSPGKCPECGGQGYLIFPDENDNPRFRDCACRLAAYRAARYATLLEESDLPERAMRYSWDTFAAIGGDMLAAARCWNYATSTSRDSLYLCGPSHSGKSGLALLIALARLEQLQRVQYVKEIRLYDQLRTGDAEAVATRMDELCRCQLLVIDDVGTARISSNFVPERFFALVDERHEYDRPTVITSNLTREELTTQMMRAQLLWRLKEYTLVEFQTVVREVPS